jgi:aldose 1-epimerase
VAITCRAVTDRATLVNLTNHSFFNLAGHDAGREAFLRHELMIAADRFLPIDSTCIPSGTPAPVEGTPLDFRMPRTIGARIGDEHPQLENGLGYDHNYVLAGSCATSPRHAATLHDPVSGRTMEVHTTEPGLQWYSGNHLDGRKGKGGAPYEWRGAGCWEAQRFPDTPHHPEYPPAILRPGEIYRQTTLYLFPDLR